MRRTNDALRWLMRRPCGSAGNRVTSACFGDRVVPTIHREDGRRYHFYSNEGNEPPHVHVRRDDAEGKFWLAPVSVAEKDGLRRSDVAVALVVIVAHQARFLQLWRQRFP